MLNDPFAGGTHLNDLTLVAPAFVGDRLVGWAANRAHHADVGGMAPGSIPPAATEIYQEGLRIPPVRLTDEVAALVRANSRTPAERRGDLDAQVGANVVGAQRLAELADRPLDEVVAYGERRMRAALAALPDGRWEVDDVIDSTGPLDDQRAPARIRLALTIDGETATFDFTGTDRARPGNTNAVEAVTASAVAWALRSVTDPDHPRQRRRPAAGGRPRSRGKRRGGPSARRRRRRQRRGQPTRRRRLPARPGPGGARPGGRGRPGDHEQPDPGRRLRAGCTTRPSAAVRGAGRRTAPPPVDGG